MYRLSFRQLVIGPTVVAAVGVGFGMIFLGFRWPDGLAVGIAGCVWLVGLNLFIEFRRFQKLVLDAIDTAPRIDR